MSKTPADIRSLARNHTAKALSTLASIMNEPKSGSSARVMAANALLDRGWGKPDATVTFNDKRDATDWTRDELVAFLSERRANRAGIPEEAGSPGQPDRVH